MPAVRRHCCSHVVLNMAERERARRWRRIFSLKKKTNINKRRPRSLCAGAAYLLKCCVNDGDITILVSVHIFLARKVSLPSGRYCGDDTAILSAQWRPEPFLSVSKQCEKHYFNLTIQLLFLIIFYVLHLFAFWRCMKHWNNPHSGPDLRKSEKYDIKF